MYSILNTNNLILKFFIYEQKFIIKKNYINFYKYFTNSIGTLLSSGVKQYFL